MHRAESEGLAGGGEQWVDNKRKGSLPWSRLQHITQLVSLSHSWWWWWSLNSTEKKQFPGNAPGGAFNQAQLETTATEGVRERNRRTDREGKLVGAEHVFHHFSFSLRSLFLQILGIFLLPHLWWPCSSTIHWLAMPVICISYFVIRSSPGNSHLGHGHYKYLPIHRHCDFAQPTSLLICHHRHHHQHHHSHQHHR